MKNKQLQASKIEKMETPLSASGVHGGNVVIFNPDLFGANSSVPKKPSLRDVNVARMFQRSTWFGQNRLWKDVCRSENNQQGSGTDYLRRVKM